MRASRASEWTADGYVYVQVYSRQVRAVAYTPSPEMADGGGRDVGAAAAALLVRVLDACVCSFSWHTRGTAQLTGQILHLDLVRAHPVPYLGPIRLCAQLRWPAKEVGPRLLLVEVLCA